MDKKKLDVIICLSLILFWIFFIYVYLIAPTPSKPIILLITPLPITIAWGLFKIYDYFIS